MQLGFQAVGFKSDVIESVRSQAIKQTAKFEKICKEHKVPEFGQGLFPSPEGYKLDKDKKIVHKTCPIKDTTSSALVLAATKFVEEHLAHVGSEEEVSVSFSMTVNRPHPQ